MTAFAASWLDAREPIDAAARGDALVGKLAARLDDDGPLAVVDLGAGTGANLRFLAPALARHQHWLLVDNDPALAAAQHERIAAWAEASGFGVAAERRGSGLQVTAGKLDWRIDSVLLDLRDGIDRLELSPGCLVTASAVLDLVSRDWLDRLVGRLSGAGARCLFALSYDGRAGLDPPLAGDERVLALFNEHQRTDKGFGPALGPAAASTAMSLLDAAGFTVATADSDWRIGPGDPGLQQSLLDGWIDAALEVAASEHGELERWARRRREQIDAGRLQLFVGHTDIAAWPSG